MKEKESVVKSVIPPLHKSTVCSLNEHIKYTHERKERPPRDVGLRCNDCVFESDSQEKLNTHVRKVHEQAKCNVCNVRLPKAELKLHVRVPVFRSPL